MSHCSLADLHFSVLPLTENTGHRASIYMEEYSLAIAIEANRPLFTANDKHYKPIKKLQLQRFRP